MTDQYAVFGNPIAHSKSPRIHTLFAEQTEQNIEYSKQLVELGHFAEAAKKFFDEGGKGLNVTAPFKLDAFEFAQKHGSVSERAKLAGAVNTLKKEKDGKTFGDNTDGAGLVRDITQNLGWAIKDKNILILGAGGAVRGVLGPLLAEKPAEIVIAARTLAKAEELKIIFNSKGNISVMLLKDIPLTEKKFDLIIHGTPVGLSGGSQDLSTLIMAVKTNEGACAYDMVYGVSSTLLINFAKHHGMKHTADGLGMLVEQAAESFCLWYKEKGIEYKQLDTQAVIDKVRSEL